VLAGESIELAEYSAHYATLTVTWAVPFAGKDVGYIPLQNSAHENWTEAEKALLAELYPNSDRLLLLRAFPARTWNAISNYANSLGMTRGTRLDTSDLDPMVSLRDKEVQELIGIRPHESYAFAELWVYSDIVSSRSPTAHNSGLST
jgi:hypothetical protein